MAISILDNPNPPPNYMSVAIFANPLILDVSDWTVFYCVITGDTEIQMTNTRTGGTYLIELIMDDTGGHTVSFDSSFRWLLDGSASIDTTAGAINLITVVKLYDEYLAYHITGVTEITTTTTTTTT